MSSGEKKNDGKGSTSGAGEDDGGGGWVSTLFKVAGAAAATVAVASSMYSLMKQPEPEQVVAHGGAGGGGGGAGDTYKGAGSSAAVAWTKPLAGWVKLNVDGSHLDCSVPVTSSCGGVLRDATGNWVCGFAQKLDPKLREDETEREGILIGLEWAQGKGVKKVMVESDNKGVVELVTNWRRSNDPRINRIRDLLNSRHWEATLTWVDGDANKVADKVAHNAHDFPHSDLHEYDSDSPPDNCILALSKDMQALLMRN